MFYSVIDSLNQTLGTSHTSIEAAADTIEELGEAAGEMSILEVRTSLGDGEDISEVAGQIWVYDFIKESLVKL